METNSVFCPDHIILIRLLEWKRKHRNKTVRNYER